MLIARDITLEAGIRILVTGCSFSVHPGDKIGLVGANGAGKTTLLRVLMGEVPPRDGTIGRSGVLGYLSQEADLADLADTRISALERILTAREIGDLELRMEDTRLAMERTDGVDRDRLIRRFARLEDEFTARGGYVAKAEAKRFAHALGITTEELSQTVVTMSGGQRRRVELARILFAETDVLLLDEPTNHLDLDAKSWLMHFLGDYAGGLLVVSHDLPLLDGSITSVLALENERVEAFKGTYSHYLSERDQRRAQRLRERKHQDEKIERLEAGIRRFKGRTEKLAKRARSWETRVAKLKTQRVEIVRSRRNVAVRFPQPGASGRTPLAAHGLAKAFDHNVVFVDIDVDLDRGERMIIMGLNGAGKTTLLRILAGVETPDLGEVERGIGVSIGYYAQEHEQIKADMSVLAHMREASTEPDQGLRSVLGHFLLADKIEQDAGTLSGGEKTKLALARLVVGRHNVLLLDEPTNNLDPQAKSALLDALVRYEGTLVIVSHDSGFVEQLVPDRAIVMPDGETMFFEESMMELVALA